MELAGGGGTEQLRSLLPEKVWSVESKTTNYEWSAFKQVYIITADKGALE